ncbi:MAG: hypothetical protein ACREDA_07535 [Methylocella sp.]
MNLRRKDRIWQSSPQFCRCLLQLGAVAASGFCSFFFAAVGMFDRIGPALLFAAGAMAGA